MGSKKNKSARNLSDSTKAKGSGNYKKAVSAYKGYQLSGGKKKKGR